MRAGLIILALVAAAVATPVYQRAANQELLKKQQDTIHLLEHIVQSLPNQELYNLGYNYDIESNVQNYHEPNTVLYYVGMVKAGHVQPKGTVYSNSVSQLRKEVALLTRILLAAKDYSCFLHTAAWARVHVNEGQFVKAYISAIFQREDTVGVIPPPLYEIFPQNYIDSRIIQEAQHIYTEGYEIGKTVYIPVNYTDYLPFGEHQLSYFTHDIGLNAYYAYISLAGSMIPKLHQPVGYQQVIGSEYEKGQHIGRGAYYYYLHQQLLARYNLNRLGTGLGSIDNVDYEDVRIPFKPHLHHANSLEYPGRDNELHLTPYHQDLINNVYAFEKRLMNAIDSGYVITPQQQFLSLYQPHGLNILGDLIEGTGRSVNPRYYGSLQAAARQLLGNVPEFHNIWSYTPSALELDESAVRDPAFYQLYKRIINLFLRYQQSLPAYQYNDLVLSGVKIEKVIFPKLVTFFDQYNIDLDGGYIHSVKEHHEDVSIKAQLSRLNHQPYEYQIVVHSEKPLTNAVVRVYLGPKYDYEGHPVDINHHRHYFVELDQFVHDLNEGRNVVIRHSQQSPIFSQDYPSVHQIKVHVDSAVRSQNPFYVTEPQQIFGFPDRLSLPKGTHDGLPLQVFVIVSSNEEYQLPYGPVVPAELQNYQHHQYQIVDNEHYEEYIQHGHHQQVQQGVHHGGYQTLEVLPHYESNGVYGNQIGKLQAYYGHYLYKKYPHQYPVYHNQQGYQHVEYAQQHGSYHSGVHQGVPVHQPHHIGQHVPTEHTQYTHHGQVHQGQVYQGLVHQGQVHQGLVHPVQSHQEHILPGQIYEGHGYPYQQVQDVPQAGVEVGKQSSVYQSLVSGHHGVHGVYPGDVHSDVTGTQNIVGGQMIHGDEQSSYKHQHSEHLQHYYDTKHISEIIGGALSLDNKPLGYPFERPLGPSVFYVPNIHVTDVIVHHVDHPIERVY